MLNGLQILSGTLAQDLQLHGDQGVRGGGTTGCATPNREEWIICYEKNRSNY